MPTERRDKNKRGLKWIVYDENGAALAAFRYGDDADRHKPEHGFVYRDTDPAPNEE